MTLEKLTIEIDRDDVLTILGGEGDLEQDKADLLKFVEANEGIIHNAYENGLECLSDDEKDLFNLLAKVITDDVFFEVTSEDAAEFSEFLDEEAVFWIVMEYEIQASETAEERQGDLDEHIEGIAEEIEAASRVE